ncbi:MAG: hypothetical protein M1820_006165 [Bogoriella megaspora]|nr:MAG: hypothetical protein M1820_006165 [Bogoriella megaspora]
MPKQVIVQSSIEAVEIIETPIPTPLSKEIVIKVVVSGTNPKDWKYPLWRNLPHNSGDDIAGIVYAVGNHVYEFKPGDRVAALHLFGKENGSFAEYAVAPDWTTFHVPNSVTFEEAATIPLSALTAAIALYVDMRLPAPYNLTKPIGDPQKSPILIYGVTSAVGAFAAKFARLSGMGPIIGVAGRASDFARTLVDFVVDYRNGEDELVVAIEDILIREGLHNKLPNVFDAISENGSLEATVRLIEPNGGIVCTVLPPKMFARDKEGFAYPSGVKAYNSAVPQVHSTHKDFGYLWSRYLGRLLEEGTLKAHPFEVIPGGLHGVLTGLKNLKNGKASAVKYVYRIGDTKDMAMSGGANDVNGASGQAAGHRHQPTQDNHLLRDFPFPSEN